MIWFEVYFVQYILNSVFVMAKRATLLVDIQCPRVGFNLVYLSNFSGLAALMSADIARNL